MIVFLGRTGNTQRLYSYATAMCVKNWSCLDIAPKVLCRAVQDTPAAVEQKVTNTCAAAVAAAESKSSKAWKAVSTGSKVQCWLCLCGAL